EDAIRDYKVTGVQTCALPIYLPGVVPNGGRITLRQLLSHTSGLPDYFNNPRIVAPYSATKRMHAWPHLEIARISAADKPLFAPRSEERRAGKECRPPWS